MRLLARDRHLQMETASGVAPGFDRGQRAS
jgi:hypothetical protein